MRLADLDLNLLLVLDTVLAAGEQFFLRATANISTGGTAIDRTTEIHIANIEIARRAARVIGLDIAGVDVITPDISQSLRDVGGGIVEVNAGPHGGAVFTLVFLPALAHAPP